MEEILRARRKPQKCPACGSVRVARILYGMMTMSPALERDLKKGRIVIGGCEVTGDDPAWACGKCGAEIYWNREPTRRASRADKFLQPISGIEIVSRSGSGTLLTPDVTAAARQRVADGEDLEKVAEELAIEDVALREGLLAQIDDDDET